MALDLVSAPGATPLGPEELQGLKPTHIVTQAELDAAEAANIGEAIVWMRRSRRKDLLHRDFVLELHRRMFGDVWRWAGTWRRSETNIGVEPASIPVRLEALLNDVRYWMDHATYSRDELAIRLHHQMVFIHPFPNGNGRHTRLMADLIRTRLGSVPFTWGGRNLSSASDTRRTYIDALRTADRGDLAPLLDFARR
jgi:Fic-DOC domain mobile mystery protein B